MIYTPTPTSTPMVSQTLMDQLRTHVLSDRAFERFYRDVTENTDIEEGIRMIDDIILVAMNFVDDKKDMTGREKKEAVLGILETLLESSHAPSVFVSWGKPFLEIVRPHVSIWIDTVVQVRNGTISFREGCWKGILRTGSSCLGR